MKKHWKAIIIAVISVGVAGVLIWIGIDVWDGATLSADECSLKAKYMAERVMDDINRERMEIRSRHRLLQELRNSQYKVTSEMTIKQLEETYGKLNANISDRGFVLNILEIEERIKTIDQQRLARFDKDLIEAELMQSKATYMRIKGSEWFTTEHGAGKEFDELAKSHSPEQMIEMVKKLARSYYGYDE